MDNLNKILKDNLTEGEFVAPDFVWENIEKEIAPKNRRGGFIFIGCAGLLAVTGAIFLLVFWGSRNLKTTANNKAVQSAKLHQKGGLSDNRVKKDNPTPDHTQHKEQSEMAAFQEKAPSKPINTELITEQQPLKIQGTVEEKSTNNKKVNSHTVEQATNAKSGLDSNHLPVINAKQTEPTNLNRTKKDFKDVDNLDNNNESTVVDGLTNQTQEQNQNSVSMKKKDSVVLISNVSATTSNPVVQQASTTGASKLFIEPKVGVSLYNLRVWDSSFVVGALSTRPFKANGFNYNLDFGYEINKWFNPLIGVNFNQKNIEFNYSALYDDHGFLIRDIRNELLPLEEINDVDFLCNNHVLDNISASFTINSYSLAIGNRLNVFKFKKLALDWDMKYNLELSAKTNVNFINQIEVTNYLSQNLNSRVATGLSLNYQLNESIRLVCAGEYLYRKNKDVRSLYQGNYHELNLSAGVRIYLPKIK